MTTDYFTPYQDGITQFKSAYLNAPLEEIDAAIGTLDSDKGDVSGPASATDNAIARFDTATGKLLQNSLATINDAGAIDIPSGQLYKIDGYAHTHEVSGGVGLSFEATAKPTASGAYNMLMPYDLTVPANCAGSAFYNATNPTAQVVVSIEDDGTEIATLTVATNGTPTWSSAGATIAVGSRVSFVFPAQDATWAGVAITLQGVRTIS